MNILQWIVVTFAVFGLSRENTIRSQCGKKVSAGLIHKESEEFRDHWPWLAFLKMTENGKIFCGATLISLNSVLTAAHCLQEKHSEKMLNPSEFKVQLAQNNMKDFEASEALTKFLEPIEKIAIHPDWNPSDISNNRYDADLALLIAAKEIEYSPFISPICLPHRDIQNVKGMTVNWEFSNDEKKDDEDMQRLTELQRVSQEECFLEDNDLAKFSSNRTFCAKKDEDDANSCQGNGSGGGYFAKSGDVWFIHGVASFSAVENNCQVHKHSIFTKLSSFLKWIEEETHTGGAANESYAVMFIHSLVHSFDEWKPSHELATRDVLRKGVFLSTLLNSNGSDVNKLWCVGQNWGFLPNNMGFLFPNLKEFEASSLKIQSVERVNFKNMRQVEVLCLKDNLIEKIPTDCFEDMKNLAEIDISKNNLKSIHSEIFNHISSLKKINLNENQIQPKELRNLKNENVEKLLLRGNHLKSVSFDAFDGLANLKFIDLSENNLTTFHRDNFMNNRNLTAIHARGNQIYEIDEGFLRDNKDLSFLDLSSNKIAKINTTFSSLGKYNFERNVCINENFSLFNQNELDRVNENIKLSCGQK